MRSVRVFISDDRGAVTIEFVTIFIGFVWVMLMFVDASILFLTHTEMFNVSRDAARRVAVGALHADDVPAYISERVHLGDRTYTVGEYHGTKAVVDLIVNVGDASIFGFFTPVLGKSFHVHVEMLREPTPQPLSSGGGTG